MKKIVITLLMCLLLMSGCGSESEEFLELADQYFAEGQYEHAAYNYVRALELDRENKDAYMNLIDSYMELWKLDDAMDYLEEAELMFGARAVEDKRAILEEMMPKPTPRKEEPTPTEVPVVEETPIPEATVVPTDAPVVEPTEVPESTVTSVPEYTFTDVDATMYVTADVNVRTLPSTDGKKVGSLSKDTKIDVLRQCNETGWYEFEYDGELRYASSKYFSMEKPEVKVTSTPIPKPTSKATDIDKNIERVKEYIATYGETIDDCKYIAYLPDNGFDIIILYDTINDTLNFSISSSYNELYSSVSFYLVRSGTTKVDVVYLLDNEQYVGLQADMDVEKYAGQDLGFAIVAKELNGIATKDLEEILLETSNLLKWSMYAFDIFLQYHTEISMEDIGFVSFDFSDEEYNNTQNSTKYSVTKSQEQAVKMANTYLNVIPFSYTGLIEQLEYEGFSKSDATYGADNCGANWYKQATKCAENYLKLMAFSRSGLIEQLEYEGFTHDQAVYGVEQNGL